MMKPQNRRRVVLPDMTSHKSLLHGVGGMQGVQLGTTIYDADLKDWDKNQTKNTSSLQIKFDDQWNLLSTLVPRELDGQL